MAEPAKHYDESLVWRSSKRAWLGRHKGRFCLIANDRRGVWPRSGSIRRGEFHAGKLGFVGSLRQAFWQAEAHSDASVKSVSRESAAGGNSAGGRSQIRRALAELEIEWFPTDLLRTSGSSSEFFKAAKRELGSGLRNARAKTLADASRYVERVYLPAWHELHAIPTKQPDAHRPLTGHDLDAILSEVEVRTVSEYGTVQFYGASYRLPEPQQSTHMNGAQVQLEKRRDGSVYLRTADGCFHLEECDPRVRTTEQKKIKKHSARPRGSRRFNRAWMRDLPEPPLWRSLS